MLGRDDIEEKGMAGIKERNEMSKRGRQEKVMARTEFRERRVVRWDGIEERQGKAGMEIGEMRGILWDSKEEMKGISGTEWRGRSGWNGTVWKERRDRREIKGKGAKERRK